MKTHTKAGIALPTSVPSAFFDAYVECALWSSSGTISAEDLALPTFDGKEVGDDYQMDDHFGEDDISPDSLDQMLMECADFFNYCEAEGIDPLPDYGRAQSGNAEMSGHDFWLTRNGHGAGYWDRGLDTGDVLTAAAKTFGSSDLYVGDDGLVYVS